VVGPLPSGRLNQASDGRSKPLADVRQHSVQLCSLSASSLMMEGPMQVRHPFGWIQTTLKGRAFAASLALALPLIVSLQVINAPLLRSTPRKASFPSSIASRVDSNKKTTPNTRPRGTGGVRVDDFAYEELIRPLTTNQSENPQASQFLFSDYLLKYFVKRWVSFGKNCD